MPRTQTSGTKTGSVDWLLFSFTLFCKEKQIYRSYHIRSQIYWVLISYQYLQTGKGSSSSELISENNWVATESNIHSNSVSFMFNFCYYNWKKVLALYIKSKLSYLKKVEDINLTSPLVPVPPSFHTTLTLKLSAHQSIIDNCV